MLTRIFKKIFNQAKLHWNVNSARGLILLYHRVSEKDGGFNDLSVSPARFKSQLTYLKKNYICLDLESFLDQMARGTLRRKSVLVTFDDGYHDNFNHALPIAEELGVPLTIYIATKNIGTQNLFWWDQLELLLKDHFSRSSTLKLHMNGEEKIFVIRHHSDIKRIYFSIHKTLKKTPHQQRLLILEQLRNLGASISGEEIANHRSLSFEELQKLAASPIVTIGAHTANHVVLSSEETDVQESEIQSSKMSLEQWINKKIDHFAYPFGSIHDYTAETLNVCKKIGFKSVMSNHHDIIGKWRRSPFNLPRVIIRNWETNTFEEQISEYLLGSKILLSDRIKAFFFHRIYKKKSLQPLLSRNAHLTLPKTFTSLAVINTHDIVGGAAKLAHRLTEKLRRDLPVTYFVSTKISTDSWIHEIPRNSEDKLHNYWAEKNGYLDLGKSDISNLLKHPDFSSANHVHLHNAHGNYFSPQFIAKIASEKKLFWTLHDMHALTGHCAHSLKCDKWKTGCAPCGNLDYYPAIKKDKAAELWTLKNNVYANCAFDVIVPSQWLFEKVQTSVLKEKRVHFIPNGVDHVKFHPMDQREARLKIGIPVDAKVVLFCANGGLANHYKGGKIVSNLYSKLEHRADVQFLNIGGNSGVSNPRWIEIPYVSSEEEMNILYNCADLLLYPSYADNCPLVVLEAKSCGLPVIASRVGGIPELINEGKDGFTFDNSNPDEILKKVLCVLDDIQKKHTMARNARKDILDRFTLDQMEYRYRQLFFNHDTSN